MKLSYSLALFAILGNTEAFSVVSQKSTTSTQLQAQMGRREMVTAAAFSAGALLVPVEAAFAEYVPRIDDMKQIYCKYERPTECTIPEKTFVVVAEFFFSTTAAASCVRVQCWWLE